MHVVVTICLVIALLFALGWIYWQNFIAQDAAKVQENSDSIVEKTPDTSSQKTSIETVSLVTNYGMKYLSGWEAGTEVTLNEGTGPGDARSEKLTVTSPSGNVIISLQSYENGGGIGGTCDGTQKVAFSLSPIKLANIEDVYLNTVVFSSESNPAQAVVGLSKHSTIKECNYPDVFSNEGTGNVFGTIKSKAPLIGGSGPYASLEEYKKFFTEDVEFKAALEILSSAYIVK